MPRAKTKPKPADATLSPEQKRIALHAELAAKAFAHHKITQKLNEGLYRSWRCGAEQSSFYHFHITTIPGYLFVTGDIGELIVSREADMIAWCRLAIDDLRYFASKMPSQIVKREYDPDVARAWIDELLANVDGSYRSIDLAKLTELRELADDPHQFQQELHEEQFCDGADCPDFNNYTSNYLWCREAIKWLLERLPEVPA